MLDFIRRLFRKTGAAPEPGSIVEELWSAELSNPKKGRFLEEEGGSWAAAYRGGSFELELKRPELFAWSEAPLYRHSDFAMEGEIALDPMGPYAAAGFVFRYQDESNFYVLLASNRGYFRLDVVFNGSPRALVAWTELPPPIAETWTLLLIARGSHFTVGFNGTWVAEAVDETFRYGSPGFASQRYSDDKTGESQSAGQGKSSVARLLSCFVEARPLEVEAWYYRWNYSLPPSTEARKRLAGTFFSMGEHLAAAIQLRKNERRRPLDADELFLKAEVSLRLGLNDEAESSLDACLALDPGRKEAVEEKANLLYLAGRNTELRDLLQRLLPTMPDNARLACLSGHARFALGDFVAAAEDYRRAAELDGEQALFRMNEARAWDQARRNEEAAEAYLSAARLFFSQDADDDFDLAMHRIAALKPRSAAHRELKAKSLFRRGKKGEAERILADLAAKGSEDSAVHYLLGLILSGRGKRVEALPHFDRALRIEPDYPLYSFRRAECLFLLGERDEEARAAASVAIREALALAPDDGWTLNLAGQDALRRQDHPEARRFLEAACAALPQSPAPAINLSELEAREGRTEKAIAILASFPDNAECRNQAGNVWAGAGAALVDASPAGASSAAASPAVSASAVADPAITVSGIYELSAAPSKAEADRREELLEKAVREYEKACRLDPTKSEYFSNLGAACIELERYSEAETHLRHALELGPEPRSCLLTGNLATVFGDRPRAEAAWLVGLEIDPGDPALLLALGRSRLKAGETAKARQSLAKLELADAATAARFSAEIVDATTELISCACCSREWRVPRDLPAQSGANVRDMPPDDSPAGACPNCAKVFCIGCRKDALVDNRFTCPECGIALKLSDNRLRWLVRECLKKSGSQSVWGQGGKEAP